MLFRARFRLSAPEPSRLHIRTVCLYDKTVTKRGWISSLEPGADPIGGGDLCSPKVHSGARAFACLHLNISPQPSVSTVQGSTSPVKEAARLKAAPVGSLAMPRGSVQGDDLGSGGPSRNQFDGGHTPDHRSGSGCQGAALSPAAAREGDEDPAH
eukprot:6177564-Pleurochrysis_carterae.AAC.1